MIPIKLRLSGFTSYREPVEIDFSGFDLACISGPNGAGKSSLLDAITFALYGKARVQSEAIINTVSEKAEVSLDFEYEGQVYRVTRVNTRGKSSQVDLFIRNQTQDDNAFTWKSLTEHTIRETDAKIRNTLRLDYESFVNASFFLQGKADSFATKKPAERKDILSSILGLDQWELFRKAANDKSRQARNDVRIYERDVAMMQEEIETEDKLRSDRLLIESDLALVREKVISRQAQLDLIKAEARLLANRMQQLDSLKEQLARANDVVNKKQRQIDQKRATLGQYQLKIDQAEQIEEAYQQLVWLKSHLSQMDKLSERYWPLERQRSQLQAQLEAQKQAMENDLRELTVEKVELERSLAGFDDQQTKLTDLTEKITQIDEALSAGQDYEAQLQALREQTHTLEGNNGALRNQMEEIKQRTQKLEDAQGASCPMCGQDLSPSHREQLMGDFNSNGKVLGDQYRLNKAEMNQLKEQIQDLEARLRQVQQLEKQRLSLQSNLALIKQTLDQLSQRKESWQSNKAARFEQLQKELAEDSFFPEKRLQLRQLDQDVLSLSFDPEAHNQARQQVQVAESSETAWQDLQIARSNFDLLKQEVTTAEQELSHDIEFSRELNQKYDAEASELAESQAKTQDSHQAETELSNLREEQDVLNRQLGEIDQSLAAIQNQRERQKRLHEQIDELNEKVRQYSKLETAFGKDGVPAMLIEQALPELEDQANQLLLRLSDYTMSVRFNTQRAYKDTKRKDLMETLDIIISDGHGSRDYETYSGGEAFRINFAIRLALSRILAHRAGARLQTLVIDEGFGNQDAQGRQRLIGAINIVRPDFEKILIITHIDELKDYFSNRIEVSKTPSGSQAEVVLG